MPIALRRTGDDHDLDRSTHWFVWIQLAIVYVLMVTATICLLLVIRYLGLGGPFFVGIMIQVASVVYWLPSAYLVDVLKTMAHVVQRGVFVLVIILGISVAANERVFGVNNFANRCNPTTNSSTPLPDLTRFVGIASFH